MRIFPYLTCWHCSNQPMSRRRRPRQDTVISAGCIADCSEGGAITKKERSWIRKTKHQAAAGLGRVIDGMIFGLVSFFVSVVYWLHDVHPCIHIGLLRLRPAGLCTGLHSCWGQYLISLGSNMVRIQRVSLVLRKSGVGGPWRFTVDPPLSEYHHFTLPNALTRHRHLRVECRSMVWHERVFFSMERVARTRVSRCIESLCAMPYLRPARYKL